MNTLRTIVTSRTSWIVICIIFGAVVGLYFKGVTAENAPAEVADCAIGNNDETVVHTTEQPAEDTETTTLPAEEIVTPIYTVETDESGTKLASGHLLKDIRVGQWEIFHRNGQLECTGKYTKGTFTGIWRFYYPTGKLRSEGRFDLKGRKTGLWTTYHSNGDVRTEGKYKSNIRIDTWTACPYEGHPEYFWSGWLNSTGQRDRLWTWHVAGKPLFTDAYTDGKFIGRTDHQPWQNSDTVRAQPANMEPEFRIPDMSSIAPQSMYRRGRRWR